MKPAQATDEQAQAENDEKVVAQAQSIWKYCSEARRRAELEWFINQQAHDNYQFLYYNIATRMLQTVPFTNKRDKVVINRVKHQVRSVVSFINQRKPHVTLIPGEQADDAYLRSRKSKYLCDYWYDALEMNKKNKLISKDGCINGLGWAKILWNKDALAPTVPFSMDGATRTKQYGEVMFERCDPFEVYPDPLATCKADMRYLVHAIPRTIGELKNNPEYKNTNLITPDKKLAASFLKQTQLRQNVAGGAAMAPAQVSDLETVIVLEVFWREWNDESRAWKIRVVTMTESGVLLRSDYWPMDELPFEPFMADIAGSLLQSKGMVHDIREPNRAVNDLMSQLLESSRVMGKLNWLMPRGSNPGVITDETGQFIEYDVAPGGAPHQAQPAGLPSYIENLVTYFDSAIMDLGGAHDASVGRTVFKGASGDLVQSLQFGDANSLAMLRDNYDDFLIRCFKLMLRTAKHFGKTSRRVRSGQPNQLGEYRWEDMKPEEISTEDDIQVRSASNLPFSNDQRQEFFLGLWREKVIQDPSALLKLMELPDIANTLGDDELVIERELNNIKALKEGKDIPDPVIAEGHSAHVSTIDKFIRSADYLALNPEQQGKLTDHRSKHIDMIIQIAKAQALNQYEPIKRTEQIRVDVRDMAGTTPMEREQLFEQFAMTSDSFQIQRRGGLVVQDPADAEMQAQNEDIDLMDGKVRQISLGDNHQVHLQTHYQVMQHPNFQALPEAAQEAFKKHTAMHEHALEVLQPMPGLVPDNGLIQQQQPQQPPQAKK